MKRVLCVEGNSDECELIVAVLSGYDVTCVKTIAQALPLLASIRYVLVIIDEHLPDGSGFGLCSRLMCRGLDVPVIMISGDPYITSVEAREAGAEVLLNKSSRVYIEDLRRFADLFALNAKAKS